MKNQESLLSSDFKHASVLVQEVVHAINPQPGGLYLDVTFGSGGHTRAILEKEPQCRVVAMDWDTVSFDTYVPDFEREFGDRFLPIWGNFAQLYTLLKKNKIGPLNGILADFGTSHMQISFRPGFSVHRDNALDMRMSPAHQKITAQMILNTFSEKDLQEIFFEYGQERYAKKIARAIVDERLRMPFAKTKRLADLIERVVPRDPSARSIHPATRIFQALRIYVNRELDNINAFLPAALAALAPHGRLLCISFHSLEDRIVKYFFREQEKAGYGKVLSKKAIIPSEAEIAGNRASRSAKLRVFEKITSNSVSL